MTLPTTSESPYLTHSDNIEECEVLVGRAANYRRLGVGWTLKEFQQFMQQARAVGNTNGPWVVASSVANSMEELITMGYELQAQKYTSPTDKDPEYFI